MLTDPSSLHKRLSSTRGLSGRVEALIQSPCYSPVEDESQCLVLMPISVPWFRPLCQVSLAVCVCEFVCVCLCVCDS